MQRHRRWHARQAQGESQLTCSCLWRRTEVIQAVMTARKVAAMMGMERWMEPRHSSSACVIQLAPAPYHSHLQKARQSHSTRHDPCSLDTLLLRQYKAASMPAQDAGQHLYQGFNSCLGCMRRSYK